MRISVLDHSGVSEGQSADTAIRETLALARHCERLGFYRYWVSEHHANAAMAGTAPEILIAAIAATTQTMRVGSGGVMLPHYAALKVAEQFRVLEAIAPGRIDLGVGRAPGSDGLTAVALNPRAERAADGFPSQVRDLQAWLHGESLPAGHPFAGITAQPGGPTAPELWILGSSEYGAGLAAAFGLPYCFAHFFNPGARGDAAAAAALALYRGRFQPSLRCLAPRAGLCLAAFAADTAAEAEYQLGSRLLWQLRREQGRFLPAPSPATAAAYPYTGAERAFVARARAAQIYGTGAAAAAGLRGLAERLGGADELFVVSNAHDPVVRRRSFGLIAAGLGLVPVAGLCAAEARH